MNRKEFLSNATFVATGITSLLTTSCNNPSREIKTESSSDAYPHISVPCGRVYDLPVGLSFFSGAYKEGELIQIAYAYEQATKHRILPTFKKAFLA